MDKPGVEVGRQLALSQAERIELGGEVAAHPIGADQHHRPDRMPSAARRIACLRRRSPARALARRLLALGAARSRSIASAVGVGSVGSASSRRAQLSGRSSSRAEPASSGRRPDAYASAYPVAEDRSACRLAYPIAASGTGVRRWCPRSSLQQFDRASCPAQMGSGTTGFQPLPSPRSCPRRRPCRRRRSRRHGPCGGRGARCGRR